MKRMVSVCILSTFFVISRNYAQDEILAEIRNVLPEEIKVEGFRLNSGQDVNIVAVGFHGSRRHGLMFTRAWILDARNRDLIWEMDDADTKKKHRNLIEFEDNLSLPKGEYEVYYSSFPFYHHKKDEDGFGDFFSRIFEEIFEDDGHKDVYHEYKEARDQFKVIIRGEGKRYREDSIDEFRDLFLKDAIVSIIGMGDDENVQQGFKLEKPMDVQIYAIGEARKDGTFDYGWIINTETHKKIWKFNYRDSDHAGGAKKNRLVNETLYLPKGKYLAFFVTDDSHSTNRWNEAPPNDPHFWGLTIRVKNPSLINYVKNYDYERINEQQNVILKFTRLRDNEFRSKGFTCNKDLDLRIYAIGEGKRREMFDYAWIVDSKTHKKVWKMDYHNTEHAGGAKENRLYDDVVRLNKGSYIVYCVTDDNHSYWDWKAAPPYDKENWGITISAIDSNFKPDDITEYDKRDNGQILVGLVQIPDYAYERERFTLTKDSQIHIYAIGEGSHGKMYDYGWIENANSRRVVWKMNYRNSEHAGGAKKNRRFDETISLQKGEYILYFESDDSHSFEDWNAAPPYDPASWGITLYLVEND